MTSLGQIAIDYGLPNPEPKRDGIAAVASYPLYPIRWRFYYLAQCLQEAARIAEQARVVVADSWSATTPQLRLADARAACELTAERCSTLTDACAELASEIARAHSRASAAWTAAEDAVWAYWNRRHAAVGIHDEMAIIVARDDTLTAIINGLNTTLDIVARDLSDAAESFLTAAGIDFADEMPRFAPNRNVPSTEAQGHDRANRALVRVDMHGSDAHRQALADSVTLALAQADKHGVPASLISYDPDSWGGQGGVVVALGDLSSATHVTVIVPGVANSPHSIATMVDGAVEFNAAVETAALGTNVSSATVLLFDYDIPLSWAAASSPESAIGLTLSTVGVPLLLPTLRGATAAMDSKAAQQGAAHLASTIAEIRASMPEAADLTIVGHSYGSTVASQIAAEAGPEAGITNLVLLGSPGVGPGVDSADDYSAVPGDHVYVAAHPDDLITHWMTDSSAAMAGQIATLMSGSAAGLLSLLGSPFGKDPAARGFGARVIDPQHVDRSGTPISHHSRDEYLGSYSGSAVVAIAAGRYSQVPLRPVG